MTSRAPRHRTFHVHRAFYYTEDSVRGIQQAAAGGFPWIDLDCQVTSDGVLVIAHGPRPLSWRLTGGFVDPWTQIPMGPGSENTPIVKPRQTFDQLTWAQVQRLRSKRPGKDGRPYQIRRADELVPMALRKGLKVELEVKSDKITREQLAELWSPITNAVHDVTPRTSSLIRATSYVQVKGFPRFLPALKAAHDAGYTTIALTHPGQRHLPVSAQTWLDYWRGRPPIWDGASR